MEAPPQLTASQMMLLSRRPMQIPWLRGATRDDFIVPPPHDHHPPPTCADNCNDLGVHGSTVTTYEMKTYARNGTEYELWWSLQQYSMADWPQILVLEIAFSKTTIIFRDTITLQHLNMFDRWSTAVEFSPNSTTKSSYGGEFLSPSVTFIIGRPL